MAVFYGNIPSISISEKDDALFAFSKTSKFGTCCIGTSVGNIYNVNVTDGMVTLLYNPHGYAPDILSAIKVGNWLVYATIRCMVVARHLTSGEECVLIHGNKGYFKLYHVDDMVFRIQNDSNPTVMDTWHMFQMNDDIVFAPNSTEQIDNTAIFKDSNPDGDMHAWCPSNYKNINGTIVAYFEVSRLLVGIDANTRQRIWQVSDPHNATIPIPPGKHTDFPGSDIQIYGICPVGKNNQYVATAFRNGVVKFWNTATGAIVGETRFDCQIWSMQICGNWLAIGDNDGTIHRQRFVLQDDVPAILEIFNELLIPIEISAKILGHNSIDIFKLHMT